MVPWYKQLTACEVESFELSDYEQLTAVLLEGQVAEPLEDHGHLLGASVERKRRGRCVTVVYVWIVNRGHYNIFIYTGSLKKLPYQRS